MNVDSEEEFLFSSEEDDDFDNERLHFEERLDIEEDTFSDENVAPQMKKACTIRAVFNAMENLNECDNDCEPPAAKKAKTVSWKAENEPDEPPASLRFIPAREPGPQLSSLDSHSPLSLFKLFFSETTVSTLCDNTNAQAARATTKGRKYKWMDVNVEEFYRYIGLIFYMATVKMCSIHDYWRQDSLFSVPFPATVMSRDRYRTISWNVHLSHPDADAENDSKRGTAQHDSLFRLKPLMDTIRLACKSFYHPTRNLAVNERLVPSRGKSRMKKTKLGFKFFDLKDLTNGYTVNFSVYAGKNSFPAGHGLSYDAVTSLLDRKVLGSGYHVYMDDFFSSPKLLKDLFARKFGVCAAYRDCRKGFPRNASNALSAQSSRGSIRWIRDGPLLCVKWMDQQEVSVCSTIHSAYTGDRVQRKVKIQNAWKVRAFPCPAPVTAYVHNMGGADVSDQLLQYYMAQHKTIKWYRKVFLHFLDIAASNAFVLHKELQGNLSHKEFLEQLTAELCGAEQKEAPKKSSSNHLPVPGAQLSANIRRVASTGRRTCVHCRAVRGKKQQTPWKCNECDVHLCIQLNRNCFQDWHNDRAAQQCQQQMEVN